MKSEFDMDKIVYECSKLKVYAKPKYKRYAQEALDKIYTILILGQCED